MRTLYLGLGPGRRMPGGDDYDARRRGAGLVSRKRGRRVRGPSQIPQHDDPDGEPMLNWIEDVQLMQWVVGGDADAAEGDERYRVACRTAYSAD